MSNPTTPFGWQMPTNTDLVTDLPADFEVFGQAVATSMADLLGGTTGQVLSKNTDADMDFVWTSPNPGDITEVTAGTGISGGGTSGAVTITNSMATAITASGDLIQGTGSGTFARLGTGTNGQYLTTNGTTLSWGTVSAGAYTLLSTTTLSGTSTTVSSISGSYQHLMVIVNNPYVNSATSMRINPNSTDSISAQTRLMNGAGSGVLFINTSSAVNLPTTSTANNTFCLQIFNYSQTSNGKNFIFSGNAGADGTIFGGGAINTTSAISAIQFNTANGTSTFSGGTVLIYGVK